MQDMYLLSQQDYICSTSILDDNIKISEFKYKGTDFYTFLFVLLNKNVDVKIPNTRVLRAIPNKNIKIKWIEKNYNMIIPVGMPLNEINLLLVKIEKFSNEAIAEYFSLKKCFKKIEKGNAIKYKTPVGTIIANFGEDVPEDIGFIGKTKEIKALTIPAILICKENPFKTRKNLKDSEGNEFDITTSPENDVKELIKDQVKGQKVTIGTTNRAKFVLTNIQKVKENETYQQGSRAFRGELVAQIIY